MLMEYDMRCRYALKKLLAANFLVFFFVSSQKVCIFAPKGHETYGSFINPFVDEGFKRIFGQEESKPVLLAFLQELLKGEHDVKDLKYLDKE